MSAPIVPIRPKETKRERFERLEAVRLAERPEPHGCDRCGYRLTSRPSRLCRSCENPEPLQEILGRFLRGLL